MKNCLHCLSRTIHLHNCLQSACFSCFCHPPTLQIVFATVRDSPAAHCRQQADSWTLGTKTLGPGWAFLPQVPKCQKYIGGRVTHAGPPFLPRPSCRPSTPPRPSCFVLLFQFLQTPGSWGWRRGPALFQVLNPRLARGQASHAIGARPACPAVRACGFIAFARELALNPPGAAVNAHRRWWIDCARMPREFDEL